ncbi:MAG: hypothetical protein ACXADW_24020 [Candidatus Hodarchaeales archaeon]|jgi:hypothetical protein
MITDNHSELVNSYIDEFEEKYFKNKGAETIQFTMTQEEIMDIYLLPDSFMEAIKEAGIRHNYILLTTHFSAFTKEVEFTFVYERPRRY